MKVKRALLSVSDKTGIVKLGQALTGLGIEIISTGGTMRALQDAGVPVMAVQDVTGFPEMMNGRVKTLHPKIHGAILAIRDNPEHVQAMKEHDITGIDLVVVNLYPFEQTIAKADVTLAEAIENIDIGGPCMVRASAKTTSMSPSLRIRPNMTKSFPSWKKTVSSVMLTGWSWPVKPLRIRRNTIRPFPHI